MCSTQADSVRDNTTPGAPLETLRLMPQIFDWEYLIRTLSEKFVPKIAQHGKWDNIKTTLTKHLEFAGHN